VSSSVAMTALLFARQHPKIIVGPGKADLVAFFRRGRTKILPCDAQLAERGFDLDEPLITDKYSRRDTATHASISVAVRQSNLFRTDIDVHRSVNETAFVRHVHYAPGDIHFSATGILA